MRSGGELAKSATAAEQAGELSEALCAWREALELLPAGTTQAASIRSRVEELKRELDATPAGTTAEKSATAAKGGLAKILGPVGVLLLFAVTKGKLLLLGLTKASTFLSMFVFFGTYWTLWGWPFALGLVLSIYIHEMGHVDALRRYGFKASAPMFIPGMGAIIRLRQHPTSSVEDARIGLAGPLWGMGAAAVCYGVYIATGSAIWAALAHMGALINIFNLTPIASLDGSRGFRALSRFQALFVTGALGGAWFVTHEGMVLLVALVAMARFFMKEPEAKPDRTAFAMFLILIVGLSALVCVRGTVG